MHHCYGQFFHKADICLCLAIEVLLANNIHTGTFVTEAVTEL